MRHCRRCDRTPEETPFGKDKHAADGLFTWCKDCKNAYARGEWKPTEEEKRRPFKLEPRQCVKCGRSPEETPFLPCTLNRDGLDNICVDCARVRDSAYMHRYYESHTAVLKDRIRRRQLRLSEAYVEFVDDRQVYERDGWTCQLCQQLVDPTLKWPDPMSASLDHIIPLSRSGPHSYSNVQLAHLVCNEQKNARVLASRG